jgi:hypothetical protein
MKNRLNILCIEQYTFLSETDLGIRVRPLKWSFNFSIFFFLISFNFSCFAVFLGSVKNIKERAVHIVLKTVLTYFKFIHDLPR